MNKKEIILAICLILVFFSALSFASASDDLKNATSADAGFENTLESDNKNTRLFESQGTFSELNSKIQNSASGSTVTLDKNYIHSYGEANGITIGKDITIDGKGFSIDGAGQSSIFKIVNNAHVVLNDIHFLNARGENGSALISSSGSFTIKNVMFINNVADMYGGAIYVADTNTASSGSTITNSTFISNNAVFGGAGYIGGDRVTCISSKFINNAAQVNGGALYVTGINNSDIGCAFINNTAVKGDGGAIYMYRNSHDFYECIPYVNSSIFNNNRANFNGGSIYGKGLFLIVRDSHFSYDTARNGAGIYLNDGATIRQCSFYKETANDNGGAIYFSASIDDSMIDLLANPFIADGGMKDSKIINCSAGIDGGAGYVAGNFAIVSNVTYINNTAGHDGGAGYITGNYAYLYNSTFINNRAARDGGALTWTGSHGNIALVQCIANRADGGSGSICMKGSDMTIVYSTFMMSNSTRSGGAIYIYGDNVTIANSLFDKCSAVAQHGGAIYISGKNAVISDCQFTMTRLNIGAGLGGSIYVEGNNAKILNTNFDRSSSYEGGFVYVEGDNIKIENMTCQHGFAVRGGSVYIKGNNASVVRTNLSYTNVTQLGGAVYVAGDFANIDRLYSEKCISYLKDGGSIYISGLNTTLSHSRFVQNMAPSNGARGGSIAIYGDNAKILNSTFEMCTSYDGGVIYISGSNTLIDGYSCTKSLAYNNGGAIYIAGNNATVADFNISLTNATQFGGAIYIAGNDASIHNSNFTKCIAHNRNGGALYVLGLNTTVTQSMFYMNKVNQVNGCGGSVAIHGDYTKILNCTFDRCTAYDGGVLYINGSYALVDGYSCTRCFAANNGGAVYVEGNHATIADFDMSLTNATNYGGALYIAGEFTKINNSTFTRCIADNRNGGALYILGKSTTLSNSTFSQNKVNPVDGRGGSIAIHGDDTNMLNCTFMMCTAYEGGLVYINGSNTNIDGFKSKMTSAVKNGGSVYIEGHDATINNFDMSLSNATDNGGAIYVAGDNVNILNGTITSTIADNEHGGAIYVGGYNTTVKTGNFDYTQAPKGYGGAIYLEGDISSVENSNFMHSFAYDGGVIYIGGHDADIINDTFAYVWASDAGGAIYIVGHDVLIDSSTFRFTNASKSNGETPGFGGAIYIEGDDVNIVSSTFFRTIAENGGYGGAIFLMGENVTIEKSNFTYCAAPDYFDDEGTASAAGAIAVGGNDATVNECNFMFCNARNGGVLFIEGSNTQIFNSNISNSYADYDGGAVYIFGQNTNISNTSFNHVKSDRHGGAVYIRFGQFTNIEHSDFIHCHSTYGGAIDVDGSDVRIATSSMLDCYAVEDGGAIYIAGNNVSMFDSNFTNCYAIDANGGAIYWIGSIGMVSGSNFINNTAPRLGGAIFMKENSKIVFQNSNFINNTAGINGGAIDFNRGAHDEVILNSTFVNNTANRSAGAVFWFGTNGNIKNSNFTNNRALGIVNYTDSYGNITYGGYGGAVMWTGAQGVVDNCIFINNYAQYNEATKSGGRGGAVYLQGSDVGNGHDTAFYNSVFINNTAGFNGGAVDWYRGASNGHVENSTFINNTAGRSGGGIYWSGFNGTIKNSKFENNSASGDITDVSGGGDGGAVLWIGSDGKIDNSNFTDNCAAYRGGAIFLKGTDDGISGQCDNVTVMNSFFENNFAGTNGGAVDFQEGATNGEIIGSVFNNNTALRSAGAVYWYGTNGTIINSNFTNNRATGNFSFRHDPRGINLENYTTMGGNGGAIVWTGTGALIDNSSFINNSALRLGGSIYIQKNANTTIENSRFINNTAGINGGAVDFNRGARNGAIINSTFENNTANRSAGAVFWFGTDGRIIASNFTGNHAYGIINYTDSYGNITMGGHGGAVMWTGTLGIVQDCIFTDNEAAKHGGAVYLQGSDEGDDYNTTFDRCIFTSNTAGDNGGAVDWHEGAHYGNIFDSTFSDNVAKSNGGAVFWNGHDGEIFNSEFINNTALGLITDAHGNKGDGGAIIWSGINGTVYNCSFTDNTAAYRGGAVYLQNCTHGNCENTTFTNSYFKNNTAGTNGGAIDWHHGAEKGLVENSTFINNTAGRSGGAIYWSGTGGTIKNSTFDFNTALGKVTDANGGGDGGAVLWVGHEGSIDDSKFHSNRAEFRGGAVFLKGSDDGSDSHCDNVIITKGIFENNFAGTNGGAVDYQEGATNGAISDSVFINNTALRSAGAVYWFGTNGTIRNSQFTDNKATGEYSFVKDPRGDDIAHYTTSGGNGGAIVWTGSGALIDNSTFTNNTALRLGGSVYIQKNSNTLIKDSHFTGNTAGINGGAVDFNRGAQNGIIIDSTFENNTANRSAGAVFWFGTDGKIINSNFTGNRALGLVNYTDSHRNITMGGDGGAVMWTGAKGIAQNCIFTDNEAVKRGGAVFLQGSDEGDSYNTAFDGCTFIGNAAGTNGGAVDWNEGAHHGRIYDSEFINNTAKSNGGAVFWNGHDGEILGSVFTDNSAENGGAIYWKSDSSENLTDCMLTGNKAKRGSAIYLVQNSLEIINSTLVANRADSEMLLLNVTRSEDNHTIEVIAVLKGGDNLINAIWNDGEEVAFKNVTYLGTDGITNTGNSYRTSIKLADDVMPDNEDELYQTQYENYQDIVFYIYDRQNNLLENKSIKTNISGVAKFTYTNNSNNGKLYELVFHPEDDYYTLIENSTSKKIAHAEITATDIYYLENESFVINLVPKNTNEFVPTGNVTVWMEGQIIGEYPVTDGHTEKITIPGLEVGTYKIRIFYTGDEVFFPRENTTSFRVMKISSFVIPTIENYTYGESGKLIIHVPQNENNTVSVILNNRTYYVKINESGYGELNIPELDFGVYSIELKYPETRNYFKSSNSTVFEIYPIININVIKSANVTDAYTCDMVNFTIIVSNDGQIPVRDINVTDILNTAFEYISSGSDAGFAGTEVGDKVIWNIDEIANGKKVILWVVVKLKDNGTFINSAKLNSSKAVNESNEVIITVKPIVDLKVTKTVNVTSAFVGDELEYVIVVYNNGPSKATGVNVSEKLSKHLDLVSSNADAGYYDESEGIWHIDLLNADSAATLKLTVKIISEGTVENTVSVISDEKDSNTSDNEYVCENVTAGKTDAPIKIAGVGDITYGDDEELVIALPKDATGTVNVTVNGRVYEVPVNNGTARLLITDLGAGDYEINVSYGGDDTYKNNSSSVKFSVSKFTPEIRIEVVDILEGEKEVLNITVNAPGSVNVTVKDLFITLGLEGVVKTTDVLAASDVSYGGKATWILISLPAGKYPVSAVYNGNENYTSVNASSSFIVKGNVKGVDVSARGITVGETETIKVTYPSDATGNVTITVNGKSYTTSLVKGSATFTIPNLKAGEYSVEISYSGDDVYLPNVTYADFKVSKSEWKLSSDDVDFDCKKITVTLPEDAKGTVTLEINGKKYSVPVKNGKAVFDLSDMNAGQYEILISYSGDDKYVLSELAGEIGIDYENATENGSDVQSHKNLHKNAGAGIDLSQYATGNPIFLIMLVMIALGAVKPRRIKN